LEKNYYKYHYHCLLTNEIINGLFDDFISHSLMDILTDEKKIIDGMTFDFSIGNMLYSTMEESTE